MMPNPKPQTTVCVRILATSDLHCALLPWDYFTDRQLDGQGLVQLAPLIRQLREEASNTMLFDNGDLLQGNPLADTAASAGFSGDHPMLAAMQALEYDAVALGNHEFDYGLEFLEKAIRQADFPMLCANLTSSDGSFPFTPEVLLPRRLKDQDGENHEIRIGVTAVLPRLVEHWNAEALDDKILALPMVSAAQAAVSRLRRAGADLVVLLGHTGLAMNRSDLADEHAAEALALRSGADVVISGHSHRKFPEPGGQGTISGVPLVNPGAFGSHIGVIDLKLIKAAARWQVAAEPGVLVPNPGQDADPVLENLVAPAHQATQDLVNEPLGRVNHPVHSHFAMIQPDMVTALVQAAQTDWMRRQLRGSRWEDWPILCAAAPYKVGGLGGPDNYTDLPVGWLTMRHVSDICPFPDTAAAIEVTGADIRAWLEKSASVFRRFAPLRTDQPLFNPDWASYLFDVISDLSWEIDLTGLTHFQPDGGLDHGCSGRIRNLCYRGAPLQESARFVLATTSYRVGGGGQFPVASRARRVPLPRRALRDIVADYVRGRDPLDICPSAHWRFSDLSGARATFLTSPTADPKECPAAEREGVIPSGFVSYRLPL